MGRGPRGDGVETAPGDFDIYLLAQSWAPKFCCTNAKKCTAVPWAFSAKHLTLHGLWPGFLEPRDGATYPSSCAAKFKLLTDQMPRDYIDVAPSFTRWDPQRHIAIVGDLAKHEYKKHGSCSGLPPAQYFDEALRAMRELPGDRGTPEMLTRNVGGTVDAAALRGEYRKRVALSADKHCRLAEVTSCWRKQPDGSVGEQCDCPPHVMKGRDNGRCASLVVAQLGQCLAADSKR